jgi:O-acetylhomoserine/O-acetylserine sulfhydrylase-like pyridoxal-dependent enzyme
MEPKMTPDEAFENWWKSGRPDEGSYANEARVWAESGWAARQAEVDELTVERDDWKSRDELNGECIMVMRSHLARVGIEATFADDAADMASQTIERLRTEVDELKRVYAELVSIFVKPEGT